MIEIDLPLLLAQLITFLIGTFLLWKIAWKPLVEILRERQEMVSKTISDASLLKTQAEQMQSQYQEKMNELDKKSAAILQQTKETGEIQKKEILNEARNQARNLLETAKKQIDEDRMNLKKELKKDLAPLAVTMAEKILKENFSQETHHRIIKDMIKEFSDRKE
ncbi:MAG: F0F1 ATP synthase subunit B [Candidatus Aureabacteria bacterium]|nr:F0F1 ATP synthase subunit B [Candidatus Auribacterota bacterium]